MSEFKDGDVVFDPKTRDVFRYKHKRDKYQQGRLEHGDRQQKDQVRNIDEKYGNVNVKTLLHVNKK